MQKRIRYLGGCAFVVGLACGVPTPASADPPAKDASFTLGRSTAAAPPSAASQTETVTLDLKSDESGNLVSAQLTGSPPFTGDDIVAKTQTRVVLFINSARMGGQLDPEIVVRADPRLRIQFLIAVLDALTERRDPNGAVTPLLKKVTLGAPHSTPQSSPVRIQPAAIQPGAGAAGGLTNPPSPTNLPSVRVPPQ